MIDGKEYKFQRELHEKSKCRPPFMLVSMIKRTKGYTGAYERKKATSCLIVRVKLNLENCGLYIKS